MRAQVLLALLVLASALPSSPALPTIPTATVEASVEEGRLVLDADADADEPVTLVVTHEDPILGDVVDRVVEMDLAANASLRATIADTRFEANFTVRLLEGNPELPRIDGVEGLLNGSAIAKLPNVSSVTIPAIPPQARSSTVRVPVYPLGKDVYSSEEARIFVTPQGHVALLALDHGALWLASSQDGGRTFSAPLTLAERPGTEGTVWYAATATFDDRIAVVIQPRDVRNDWIEGPGWRLLIVEPAAVPRVVSDVGLGESQGLRFDIYSEQLLATREGLLLSFVGAAANGSQDWAPVGRAGGSVVQVWGIDAEGTATRRGEAAQGAHYGSSRAVASASGKHVAIVGGVDGRILASRSDDGGRTFRAPQEVTGVLPEGRWNVDVTSVALDDTGTLHVAAMGYPHQETGGPVWFDGWYVRVPLEGPASSRSLGPTVPVEHLGGSNVSIYWPEVASVGPRVILVFDSSAALYETDSLDGGLTWGASIRLEGPRGHHQLHIVHQDGLGILPDGRPVIATHAGDARHPPTVATVLPYDPLPPDAQGLVELGPGGLARPPTRISIHGPNEATLPAGNTTNLYLYAQNDGTREARADVIVEGLPPRVRFLSGMTRLVLAPGEQGGFGLLFIDEGTSPGVADVTLVFRDEGRDVSAPFVIRLTAAAGAPHEEAPPSREDPPPTMTTPTRETSEPTPATSTPPPPSDDDDATARDTLNKSTPPPDAPTSRVVQGHAVVATVLGALLAAMRRRAPQ